MVSDSITPALVPSAADNTNKNFCKKKRANRSAKLKQCKFDARREQWLSQVAVKNKGRKDGEEIVHTSPIPARNESKHSLEKLEMVTPTDEENGGSIHQDSDLEFLSNSSISFHSSVLGGNDSGTNFTGTSSSSSSSGGYCSGNITEEEDCDDLGGCLDDWEAVADALAADDKQQNRFPKSVPLREPRAQMVPTCDLSNRPVSGMENSKSETARSIQRSPVSSYRAWRPDDAFRPQSLPNLSKQYSLPNPERQHGGRVAWASNPAIVAPSSCPICCEDLDSTDSSFLPCLCGFRLCLFCHKTILEADGRCPGCRKPYEQHLVETETSVHGGSLTLRLARSCSMIESPYSWERSIFQFPVNIWPATLA